MLETTLSGHTSLLLPCWRRMRKQRGGKKSGTAIVILLALCFLMLRNLFMDTKNAKSGCFIFP
jgi:hypothetical protein